MRIIANESPKRIANASGPHSAEAKVSGIMPITVVIVVSTIGRRRVAAELTTTSTSDSSGLARRCLIIESMRMIAWLMMTPPSAMIPRSDVNETG